MASIYLSTLLNCREAWGMIDSPFVLKHFADFEDYNFMYHLQEYVEGGTQLDLFSIMIDFKQFPESYSKYYASSILLALEEIHSKRIAVRNLIVS